MTRKLIGHVTVTEPFTQTRYYEYAAAWTEHEIQPGTYPVYVTIDTVGYVRPVARYIVVTADSVLTRSWKDEGIGETGPFTQELYSYQVPAALAFDNVVSVNWLGGTFTREPGVRFQDTINRDGERYGTAPVLDTATV